MAMDFGESKGLITTDTLGVALSDIDGALGSAGKSVVKSLKRLIRIATPLNIGFVKPDNKTIIIDQDGRLTAVGFAGSNSGTNLFLDEEGVLNGTLSDDVCNYNFLQVTYKRGLMLYQQQVVAIPFPDSPYYKSQIYHIDNWTNRNGNSEKYIRLHDIVWDDIYGTSANNASNFPYMGYIEASFVFGNTTFSSSAYQYARGIFRNANGTLEMREDQSSVYDDHHGFFEIVRIDGFK